MIRDMAGKVHRHKLTDAQKHVRAYLAEIGKSGGLASRRDLFRSHAKRMVEIREWKKKTIRAGKPWPPSDPRSRKLLKLS